MQRAIFTPVLLDWLIVWLAIGCAVGMVIATPLIFGIFRENPGESAWHWLVFAPLMFVGVVFAFRDWLYRSGAESFFGLSGDSHGSARFANRKDLKKLEGPNKLGSNAGLLIGRNPHTGRLLRYDGPAHVLDPFEVTGIPSAAYNPLDRLSPDSLDLGEDAASLTEALVMDAPGQVSEAHWNEEAKAILGGLIMFCVCHEEKNRRALATVREYLTLPPERLRALLELMQDSDAAGGLVAPAPPTGFSERRTGKRPRSCRTRNATPTFWTARGLPEFCRGRISTSRSCATGSPRCFWCCPLQNGRLQPLAAPAGLLRPSMTLARDAETAAVASSALSGPTERLKASNPALGGPAPLPARRVCRSGSS